MTNNKNNNDETSVRSTGAQAGFFEIQVKGQLDESWSDWLEGMELKLLDNEKMILSGHIVDQAALMGLLSKLYRLNLTLLSLREVKQKE
jgi:hypothetical protein